MTTIYHYDADTKEYLGQSVAARDPLAGKPLIPAAATTKKPPAVAAHQAALYDPDKARWRRVADHRGATYWRGDGSEHRIDRLGVTLPDNALSEPPPATIADLNGKVSKSGDVDVTQLLLYGFTTLIAKLHTANSLAEVREAAAPFAHLSSGFLAKVEAGEVKLPFMAKGLDSVVSDIEQRATAVAEVLQSATNGD